MTVTAVTVSEAATLYHGGERHKVSIRVTIVAMQENRTVRGGANLTLSYPHRLPLGADAAGTRTRFIEHRSYTITLVATKGVN